LGNVERTVYTVLFCKKEDMIYISHLDLMRLFRRALRRSGLPYVLTGGFTPRVKISLPQALKLGKESDSEEMLLWLERKVAPSRILDEMNAQLPGGIRISEVNEQ
jgi:radical SAM-linked protein